MTKLEAIAAPHKLNSNPLVSVIIDNYNYGRFLKQAIDSVLAQTYKNWELIVVDDGSTDESRSVIQSYGDRLIAVFQSNAGQGDAFNNGIAHSQGQIICFLDADDYFQEDKLAKVVASFQEHPHWVQISHYWLQVDSEGTPLRRSSTNTLSQGDVRNLLLKRGKYKSALTSALAYRREALLKVLPIPQGYGADGYLMTTIPFYGEIGCINEFLTFYRIHGKNVHARTTDIQFLIHLREVKATYINQTAAKVGLSDRFDLQKDADYRTYKALHQGGVPRSEAVQILWLILQETIVIRRSIKETLMKLARSGIFVLFPNEARTVLSSGLRGYLRSKVLRTAKS